MLCNPYVWVGVVKSGDATSLQLFASPAGGRGRRGAAAPVQTNAPIAIVSNPPKHMWLRVHCNFDIDQAVFSWSADGKEFTTLGTWPIPGFQLQTFQGVRPALFNFNTTGQPGGYADFDNYAVEEPRARGIEREIPLGKTIMLTSGADGSILWADSKSNLLVNVTEAEGENGRFQVIDLGLGRVAFKASNGRFVSAAEDGVTLKDLAGNKPGDSETFQWINLMRGDTAFMSLVNHRYLATQPNAPGQVMATATDITPARKGGVCFKWQIVN